MELKIIKVNQGLLKKDLFMGGERELTIFSVFAWSLLILISFNWIAVIIGLSGYCITMFFLRRMAQKDPELSKVYLRHIKYKPYYKAHSTPFCNK